MPQLSPLHSPADEDAPNTVSALKRKRAELAGLIEHADAHKRDLIRQLDAVEATIRIFDPTVDVTQIRPRPLRARAHAFSGEMTRIVLRTLKLAPEPLSSREISKEVMKARSLDLGDEEMMKTMVKRVGACLRAHERGGVVERVNEGEGLVWRVAR